MRISSPWTTKNKLLKQAATFFALGSLSLTAIAAPLDKSNIEFIGPLGENMQVKPFQTPHGQVIINNLLEQLQRNTQSVSVFGKKHSWQPFNKVNALTLGGLQALKFNIETTRYSQGTLTIKGIENAQLFIDAKLQKGDNHTYSLSLTNGSHSVIVVAQQVANWNNVSLDFEPKADTDNITINTSTTKRLSAEQLFDAPTISGLSLAPDAKQYVTSTRSYSNKTANQANVVTELKNSQNQTLYRFEGQQPSNMVWSPNNQFLVYMLGSELKQLNRKNLSIKTLASELEGASNFNFYDNNSLIFSWSKTPEDNNSLTKHYKGLQDRWSYARNVSQLYMLDTNSGLTKALSQGPISHSFEDANTNRGKVLMSRQVMVMQATTHPETELVELDLQSNKITSFGKFKTFNLSLIHI